MRQQFKVLLAAAGLVMAIAMAVEGAAFWQEREELALQAEALQRELTLTQQFAAAHRDYEGRKQQQEKQLAELERRHKKGVAATECLKLVQRVAAEQGVRVLLVQVQKGDEARQQEQSVLLTAEGDFFAGLRWLRKLEREGLVISRLQVQKKEAAQELRFELGIKTGRM